MKNIAGKDHRSCFLLTPVFVFFFFQLGELRPRKRRTEKERVARLSSTLWLKQPNLYIYGFFPLAYPPSSVTLIALFLMAVLLLKGSQI